jgi:serine protease AprX
MRARRRTCGLILGLLLALMLCTGTAWAGGAAIDGAVAAGLQDSSTPIPVILFADGHAAQVAAAMPAGSGAALLPLMDAVAATLTPSQILAAADLPGVQEIQADDDVVGVGWVDSLSFTNSAIGLGGVLPPWRGGPTGEGVTVAVLDSGFAAHQDLLNQNGHPRLLAFVDFTRKGRTQAYDDAGHGTFVAGLIAGDGSASLPPGQGGQAVRQYRGVAPEADIVSLKVLDKFGEGRESDVIRAIAWTIRNKDRYHIRVLNISLGGDVAGPTETDPMAKAVEAAWKSGIVVVTGAGNEGEFGRGGILSPGNDPYVITVGASDTHQTSRTGDDTVCAYSSIGPTMFDEIAKPDVVAPGNKNISLRVPSSYIDRTWPENQVAVSSYILSAPSWTAPQYFTLSGTSTAAPVVSGIVALMLDADPSLTPDDVKLRLMQTAHQLPALDPLQEGAGAVDVAAALAATSLRARGYALSAKVGSGSSVLPADTYDRWNDYKWTKYRWTKYRWTKYRWT